jgi:cytidylate kinase
MPIVVTLSASWGSGGSRIGPALADRLGVPFLDRAIPTRVAERLAVPLEQALRHDEQPREVIGRFTSAFSMLPELAGAIVHADLGVEEDYRRETERVIHERAAEGAVVLGRAGAVVLAEEPRALHVRLDGPPDRRMAMAMSVEGVSQEEAKTHLKRSDRAREAYVQHFYGVDARDPHLYHLTVDSTAIPEPACVELIAIAAEARQA